MKKNIFYAGAFMCAMAALSSCSNEVLDSSLQQDGKLSVTAGMGMDSRTAVEDELNSEGEYDIVWSGADKIYLFGNKSYAEMSLVSGAGESEAQFDGRIYGYASRLKHAIYPVPTVNGDGTFGLELGAEYDYSSNSNAPMFGSYEDGYVTFGLMTAMSRINVDVEAGDEVELIMKGADGNPVIIAGDATISSTGVLTLANDGEKSVKVTFDEAGNFMLDVPVPVGQYKGYTVKLNGEVIADKTLDAAVPLTPGQILVASSAEEPEAATPDSDEYELSTAAQLRWFAEQVNTGNTFAGKLIKLAGDIDLKNIPWTPVGNGATGAVSFRGTFDGQDHVISNIMINEGASAFDGFFGSVWGATIQNLVLEGVSVETGRLVARVNGDLASSTTAISNVTVNGSEVDNLIGKIENAAIVTIDGNKFIADGVLAKGMDENELSIYSHKGLMWFVDQVNNQSNNFAGKTVTLATDIDLDNMPWTPITGFKGTFDGAEFTISNLTINGEGKNNQGFFGMTENGEIKNLTVNNAKVSGRLNVGVVAGIPYTSKYTNIKVTGHVEVNGMAYVGAVGGKNAYANWENITVNVDETSYVNANSVENGTAYRTYVGGVVGFNGEGGHSFKNITSNIDVKGSTCDVGGLFGIAHYNNQFENCVCTGDVEIYNASEAADAEEIGGIAGVWHNENGTTVTFTNCSFAGEVSTNIERETVWYNNLVGKPYSATGKGKLIINGSQVVSSIEALKDAVKTAGAEIVIQAGEYTFPSSDIAEGVTIICEEGTTFTGTSGLDIKGATVVGATFSNPTGTSAAYYGPVNGTFKNCKFEGSNALRWSEAGETVVFEDCVFDGSVYGVHFDDGANDVIFRRCVLSGFNAFGAALTSLTFEDCTFKALGHSGYNGVNLWGSTSFKNCEFSFDGSVANEWIDCIGTDKTYEFTNCTVNGVSYTNENYSDFEDIFSRNHATVKINGVDCQM